MKTLIACICLLSFTACSAQKTALSCQNALDKLEAIKGNLATAEAALEVCAAQVPPTAK